MASEPVGPTARLTALGVVVAVLFAVLVGRLWQLQVVQGEQYLAASEENRLRDLRLPAPRGTLYDRKGRPLVTSRAAFTVSILPNEIRSAELVLPRLAAILQLPESEVRGRIDRARSRPFEPVRLRRDAPKAIVAMVEENRLDLPGVIIEVEPVRHYLYGSLAAHALGYLGEINPTELASPDWTDYRMGDLVGKGGVERVYDRVLRGHEGRQRVEVDARGRLLRVLGREPSRAGRSIVLTIDLDIQRAAEAALGTQTGAVVVLDPRNGEILALASHPAYDPNVFAAGISAARWARLTGDRTLPLLNRAAEGTYEPGSVFKIVTASAALTRGTATRATRINCPGYLRFGGRRFTDLRAHGTVDFVTGVAQSCNVFFWTLGIRTGGEAMSQMAHALGLGERTGVDLPSESAGIIPSAAWKQRTVGEQWYPGDNLNMAIGQGWVNTTPLQIARMAAAVGNGGTLLRPHLVREIIDPETRQHERVRVAPLGTIHMKAEALATLRDGLEAVVLRGTGRRVALPGLAIAGKTGSAENPRGKPHAWFTAYAPADAPRVALAVLVEHGWRGSVAAGPIAKAILATAFGIATEPQTQGATP